MVSTATKRKLSPVARASCRCSPCAWPVPPIWSTSTASNRSAESTTAGRFWPSVRPREERAAERSQIVAERLPVLAEALPLIGHVSIRNRGTIGGSISHADASAELPAVASVTDADMVIRSRAAERVVPADEFFVSHFMTALADDECLTEVRVPDQSGHHRMVIPGGGQALRRFCVGRGRSHGQARCEQTDRGGAHLHDRGSGPPVTGPPGGSLPRGYGRLGQHLRRRGGGRRPGARAGVGHARQRRLPTAPRRRHHLPGSDRASSPR